MSSDKEEIEPSANEPNPQTYYAAERTLLAWVRTGLAMMGFGFVVARFGLFLREIVSLQSKVPPHQQSISLFVGVTLVLLGVAVNIGAGIRHWYTVRRLHQNLPIRFYSISFGAIISVVIGILGLLTAAYLLFGTGTSPE